MAAIQSFEEFRTLLVEAIEGMDGLLETYSEDPMLGSIRRQLEAVAEWTREGHRPTDDQIAKLSFGVMAGKAVDDVDEDLANKIFRVGAYLRRWPK